MRVIVYTLPNHEEETFELNTYKEELAERQVADFALSQGDILGYRFEGMFDDAKTEIKRIFENADEETKRKLGILKERE